MTAGIMTDSDSSRTTGRLETMTGRREVREEKKRFLPAVPWPDLSDCRFRFIADDWREQYMSICMCIVMTHSFLPEIVPGTVCRLHR